jgi:hypothetical protein
MRLKPYVGRTIRNAFETLTGWHVITAMPQGVDIHLDLKRIGFSTQLVLDVGANVGQSAASFIKNDPKVKVYCFEPVVTTYQVLLENVKKHPGVGLDHNPVHPAQAAIGVR